MKRFTVSTMLAAGIFASLLGASAVAHADWEDTQAAPSDPGYYHSSIGMPHYNDVQSRPVVIRHR